MNALRRIALFAGIALLFAGPAANAAETPPKLRVLIFSGQNNHEWRKTTPALKQILANAGFIVDVSEHPEQCNAATFAAFDCIVSNWNNWNNFGAVKVGVKDWPEQTRKDFLDFVRSGHGYVVVHAGGASFVDWPDYQKLIGGTWGKETGHGHIHAFEVKVADPTHPITKGLQPFTTTDELWHRMATQPEKKVLATAFSEKKDGGSGQDETVALTTEFGRGRCFNLVLGHNVAAMENAGFQTLLVRGVEWAATGKVTADRRVGPASGVPAQRVDERKPTIIDNDESSGGPALAAQSGPTLHAVAEYRYGDNRASLLAAERLTLGATDEAARKSLAAKYAALLAGPATADAKRFVCRQLGLLGTSTEVPALEALLADEQFAFAARSALERIPGEESLAALRRAAEKAKGLAKAGLIQSLGVRRDPKAIPLLSEVIKDSDHVVAATALTALGRIGGDEARKALLDFESVLPVECLLPADLQPLGSESLLLIAKGLQAQGQIKHASSILSLLLETEQPAGACGAALLALAELPGESGGRRLIDALAGKDPELQSAAIRALHLDPSDEFLQGLARSYAGLAPQVQLRVVRALADGRKAAALPIITQATASKDPEIRQAAIAALSSVGNVSSVPALIDALQSDDKGLVKQVEEGLARLHGPGVDAALAAALKPSLATTQRKIIRILAERSAKDAVPAVVALADSPDAGVRAEAIRALGTLGDAKVGLQVIELLDKSPDRAALEAALVSIYRNAGSVDAVLNALPQASGLRKASLVAVLGSLGGPQACDAVRAALKTGDAEARRAALRALSSWPDAAPLDDLLAEAAATKDATNRVLALRGVANLVPLATDRKPHDRVDLLRKAIALADDAEQVKAILAALGKIPCAAAAHLASGYLKEPALRDEAALAVVEVADALGMRAREQIGGELKLARAACNNPLIQARLNAIPLGENLALGGKASNPDGLAADGEGGPPQSAIDGNPNTYWDEVDNQPLYQLRIEMKKPATVATLRILGYKQHDFAPKDFEILCDGKVVKQVRNAQYENNLLTVAVPPTRCSTVELKITGYYGGSPAIRELEIYGPEN